MGYSGQVYEGYILSNFTHHLLLLVLLQKRLYLHFVDFFNKHEKQEKNDPKQNPEKS